MYLLSIQARWKRSRQQESFQYNFQETQEEPNLKTDIIDGEKLKTFQFNLPIHQQNDGFSKNARWVNS